MLVERHGCPFLVDAVPGGKPFEPSGKDSICSEGGSTGRRTDWPCHINITLKGKIAETVRSAPGRDPRIARFIRILSALARKSDSFGSTCRRAWDIGGGLT
jgi:hypothetical protein